MKAIVTKGAPVIFAFHGTGGDERQFAGLIPQLWPGAGIVAPRGEVNESGANRYFRRTGEGVYDMEDLAARRDDLIAFARSHLTAGIPAYAFGYSNGANILAAMTFAAPGLFDRVALLHPLIPWVPEPQPGLDGKRVLVTGGARDPIAPLAGTEALARYYAAQGADVQSRIHAGGHEIRPEEIAALKTAFEE